MGDPQLDDPFGQLAQLQNEVISNAVVLLGFEPRSPALQTVVLPVGCVLWGRCAQMEESARAARSRWLRMQSESGRCYGMAQEDGDERALKCAQCVAVRGGGGAAQRISQ